MLNLTLIRKLRIQQGLTQTEMAKQLSLKTCSTYTRMENGNTKIKADDLEKIAQVLKTDIAALFELTHQSASKNSKPVVKVQHDR